RADRIDRAEMQLEAFLELGVERIVRQRHDALGLALGLGPHDRGAAIFARRDRNRPGGKKMLRGAPAVIALVADRGDDRRLIVSPAVGGDAGALADLRARAVGGGQKPRGEGTATLK